MNDKILFVRHVMTLAVAAACSQAAWAQTSPAGEQTATDGKPAESAPAPVTPISNTAQGFDSIFGATINPNQIAFTPSYESSRASLPGIMTAQGYGAPVRFGGIFVYPDVIISYGNNDNLLGASNSELSTRFTSVATNLVAEVKNDGDRYTASYTGNYTRFDKSSADNFDHHAFAIAGDNTFTSRARLGWTAGYQASTDPRGSTDRTLSATPDKWHASSAAALFAYGAQGATGRFEVESFVQEKRYDNNRTVTAGGDLNLFNVAGRFLYRVAPKTSLLFELRNIKTDYQLSTSTNTNTDRRLLVGATWEATAATTGVIKIGRLKKDFDSNARADYSGLSWEGSVRWTPLTYSAIDVNTSRAPSDSTGVGDYILNRSESLRWTHQWSSFTTTKVNLGHVDSDYHGIDLQQNTKNYGVGISYAVRRWLNLSAELATTRRTSNVSTQEYKRNVFSLSLEGTL
jgi:hypothetical protein